MLILQFALKVCKINIFELDLVQHRRLLSSSIQIKSLRFKWKSITFKIRSFMDPKSKIEREVK